MMGSGRSWPQKKVLDTLAGIATGVIGGLVMLAWYAGSSPLIGLPWWTVPNLFASSFYGAGALNSGFSMMTISGSALHLLCAGLVGGLAGFLHPGGRLFGLFIALAAYLFGYFWLWKRIAPLLLTEAPQAIMAASYFLYGSVLGWHEKLVRAVLHQR